MVFKYGDMGNEYGETRIGHACQGSPCRTDGISVRPLPLANYEIPSIPSVVLRVRARPFVCLLRPTWRPVRFLPFYVRTDKTGWLKTGNFPLPVRARLLVNNLMFRLNTFGLISL